MDDDILKDGWKQLNPWQVQDPDGNVLTYVPGMGFVEQ